MSISEDSSIFSSPRVNIHLLGMVEFDAALALQERLVYEASGQNDGRIHLLLCEHPLLITIGRSGSRGHIRLSQEELNHRRVPVRWISRGGGCVLHGPGQLAVYPIVPLNVLGWNVGTYLSRFQSGLAAALNDLGYSGHVNPGRWGLWGRTGQLVFVGVAVKSWVAFHGAFINVNPEKNIQGYIESSRTESLPGDEKRNMSSLLAERGRPAKMSSLRTAVSHHLAEAFGTQQYNIFTGHPFLARKTSPSRESTRHVC